MSKKLSEANFPKSFPFFLFLMLVLLAPLGFTESVLESSLLPKFMALSLSLVISAAYLAFSKKASGKIYFQLEDYFLVGYILLAIPASFQTINPTDSIYDLSKLILLFLVFFLSRSIIAQKFETSIKLIATFSLIATAFTLFTIIPELKDSLKIKAAFADAAYLIKGLHGHKNLLSIWLLLLLPLNALGLFYKTKIPKVFFILVLCFQLALLIALQTRSALAGFVMAVLSFLVLKLSVGKPKIISILQKTLILFGVLGMVLIFMILFTDWPINFLHSIKVDSSSAQERIILWERTLLMIKDQPSLGVGGGNWKIIFPSQSLDDLYRAQQTNNIFVRPHQDFLWIWSEYGLFSFLSYCGFLFYLIYQGLASLKAKSEKSNVITIALTGFIAFLTVSLFSFPKERAEFLIVFAILAAIISHQSKKKNKSVAVNHFALAALLLSVSISLYYYSRFKSEKQIKRIIELKDAGRYKSMLNVCERAETQWVNSDHNGLPIQWYAGIANFNLNKKQDAYQNFKKAYELHPFDFNVINNFATANSSLGNYEQAKTLYLEALQINKNAKNAKLNLILTYLDLNDPRSAKELLNSLDFKSERTEYLRGRIEQME